MSATAFQTIIDNATSISFNRRKKVAQTVSRDGTVKATSLGGQTWTFEVTPPSGLPWTTMRPIIQDMEEQDRTATSTIYINNNNHSWINGYRGNLTNVSAVTVSFSSGNTLTITGGATLSSGYRFRQGDFIQLGSTGSVYTINSDVVFNSNTITVHRPVREAAGTYTLRVGQAVSWSVICVNFPKWTIGSDRLVAWDGPFIFAEAI